MKYVLAFIILTVFYVNAHLSVLNTGREEVIFQRVSHALQLASHDAAMEVTPGSVSDGHPVFDTAAADSTFRQTLSANLDLNQTTLAPLTGGPLHQAPQILEEQYFDYSNTAFPYHYVNSTYGIDVMLYGPSIVYDVAMPIPDILHGASDFFVNCPIVQAYPDAT